MRVSCGGGVTFPFSYVGNFLVAAFMCAVILFIAGIFCSILLYYLSFSGAVCR